MVELKFAVEMRWADAGHPRWDVDETIRQTVLADEELARRGVEPAPRFREMRRARDHEYMRRWVLGCHFMWLNPRNATKETAPLFTRRRRN